MNDKERHVTSSGHLPGLHQEDMITRDPAENNTQRLLDAFDVIRRNYEQLNDDDEREAIQEAIEVIDTATAHEFSEVVHENIPKSRVSYALKEGYVGSMDVSERRVMAPNEPGTTWTNDKTPIGKSAPPEFCESRVLEVQMEIVLPQDD